MLSFTIKLKGRDRMMQIEQRMTEYLAQHKQTFLKKFYDSLPFPIRSNNKSNLTKNIHPLYDWYTESLFTEFSDSEIRIRAHEYTVYQSDLSLEWFLFLVHFSQQAWLKYFMQCLLTKEETLLFLPNAHEMLSKFFLYATTAYLEEHELNDAFNQSLYLWPYSYLVTLRGLFKRLLWESSECKIYENKLLNRLKLVEIRMNEMDRFHSFTKTQQGSF
jgi:hypothetical protein